MKILGYVLFAVGLLIGVYALTMDTTVAVSYLNVNSLEPPHRENCTSLMSDRQNILIFSGILVLFGAVLILIRQRNSGSKISSICNHK